MRKLLSLSIIHISFIPAILVAFGSQTSTDREDGSRYSINFYGKLETDAGHIYDVEQITFNKLIKNIPVYAMPKKEDWEQVTDKIRILKVNPSFLEHDINSRKIEETKLDLAEEYTIEVPERNTIWVYNEKHLKNIANNKECCTNKQYFEDLVKDTKSTLFTSIVVTDKANQTTEYLVSRNNTIYADQITPAGPKKIPAPINSVKKLTIEGFKQRESDETHKKDVQTKNRTQHVQNSRLRGTKKMKTASIKNHKNNAPIQA